MAGFNLSAQVFHYQTGKLLSGGKPGVIFWQKGIFNGYPANYGTLVANEVVSDPKSPLISLPVIHIPATGSIANQLPVYLLYGGPGESNLRTELLIPELMHHHDIIIVGYRGADGSVILDGAPDSCLFCKVSDTQQAFNKVIKQCLEAVGSVTQNPCGYTTGALATDIVAVMQSMQHDSIAILAYSYGTMVAQMLVSQHPDRVKQMVLLGARPLSKPVFEPFTMAEQYPKMYAHYTGQPYSIERDSTMISHLCTKYNLPPALYHLFAFSSLYSDNAAREFFGCMAAKGPLPCIKQKYDNFYHYFPGKVLLADMVLKKHDLAVNYDTTSNNNYFNSMVNSLNRWYFPFQSADTLPLKVPVFKGNVLIINGEYDVAAPPVLIEKELLPHWPQANLQVLPKTTHLDYFLLQKSVTDSLITLIFKPNGL